MSTVETEKQKTDQETKTYNEAKFMVEATNCEKFYLWARYSDQSVTRHNSDRSVTWETLESSFYTVGHLENRPIVVSISWHRINNYVVMFYEATSKLVDWAMIESWLAKQFPHIKHKYDAANFRHCLLHIDQIREAILRQFNGPPSQ
jgi:hypothetical protein